MLRSELCKWLRDNSSGIYRPAAEAADEIERLTKALEYAKSGISLAYDAAARRSNDEVMLHLGHHEAQVVKALKEN